MVTFGEAGRVAPAQSGTPYISAGGFSTFLTTKPALAAKRVPPVRTKTIRRGELANRFNIVTFLTLLTLGEACGLLVQREVIVARRAKGIENHRIYDRLDAVRDVTREIK